MIILHFVSNFSIFSNNIHIFALLPLNNFDLDRYEIACIRFI